MVELFVGFNISHSKDVVEGSPSALKASVKLEAHFKLGIVIWKASSLPVAWFLPQYRQQVCMYLRIYWRPQYRCLRIPEQRKYNIRPHPYLSQRHRQLLVS